MALLPKVGNLHEDWSFSYSRVVVNAISNFMGFAARAVIGFFLLRYTVRELGATQYSIVPLTGACMSYLTLLTLGTGWGMSRYISTAIARRDDNEVTRIFTSMFIILAGLGSILLVVGLVLAWQFSNILTVPHGLENSAMLFMGLTVLTSAIQLPFSSLTSGFVAAESYWLSNSIAAGYDVLRAALIILLFECVSAWVVWCAVATIIAALVSTACQWYAMRRILPAMCLRLSQFDFRLALRVMSFSLAIFVGMISGVLYWDTDRIIINNFLTAEQLMIYAVVTSIGESLYKLLNFPTMVLFPVIAKAEAMKDIALVREMVCRGTRLCVLVAVPCWLLFALLAEPFFRWYLKSQYQDVTSFVPLVAGIYVLSCSTSIIRQVPVPMGRPMFVSIVQIIVAGSNVVISLICDFVNYERSFSAKEPLTKAKQHRRWQHTSPQTVVNVGIGRKAEPNDFEYFEQFSKPQTTRPPTDCVAEKLHTLGHWRRLVKKTDHGDSVTGLSQR